MIGVSLLGATGSIGASTLAVLRQHRDTFRLVAVAARADWQGLLPIIAEFEPEVCALEDAAAAVALREAISRHHAHVRIEVGSDAVTAVAALSSATRTRGCSADNFMTPRARSRHPFAHDHREN